MTEMTAQEAVKALKPNSNVIYFGEDYLMILPSDADKIAALIEQQAATITELQTEIAYQNKQIARLQEDLIKQVMEGQ